MAVENGKERNKLVVVALCLFLLWTPFKSAARNLMTDHKYSEVKELLQRLNKPPVKSIQSPDGDIIDCIPATNQPAFDHPELKNHVIQMKPSSLPEGVVLEDDKKVGEGSINQVWHENEMKERCPEGSVAIRRIKEEEVLSAISIQHFGKKKHRNIPQLTKPNHPAHSAAAYSGHEYAVASVQGSVYYGTQIILSVYNPFVQPMTGEFSLSQLWISAGSYDMNNLNTIEVGWQVYPDFYNDNKTRLFVYWTRDAYNTTGCYNTLCPGFVQTSNTVVVGGTISPVSVVGGSQYAITILVWKEPSTQNWWLRIGSENVGYWPASLFTTLKSSATEVQWGGEIVNTRTGGQHTTTDMGSGQFAEAGAGKASLIKNIQTVDGNNTLRDIKAISYVIVDNPNCYNLKNGTTSTSGTYILYGGPGRNSACP